MIICISDDKLLSAMKREKVSDKGALKEKLRAFFIFEDNDVFRSAQRSERRFLFRETERKEDRSTSSH